VTAPAPWRDRPARPGRGRWTLPASPANFTRSGQARAELASGQEYRALAEEYRRLSDLAITAQEHTDLRLADMSVRIDVVRGQLGKMQRILAEVG
jgi:hypothetical protein